MIRSKNHLIAVAVLAASTTPLFAQQAGTWSLSAGVTRIKPSVDSASLSAPTGSMPNVRVGVSSDTRVTGAVNYMVDRPCQPAPAAGPGVPA
jgi:outer membrane protein